MSRLNYLDNLKVALTFLVIFHHAGQAYGDGGEWGDTPSNPEEVMPWILFQNKKVDGIKASCYLEYWLGDTP